MIEIHIASDATAFNIYTQPGIYYQLYFKPIESLSSYTFLGNEDYLSIDGEIWTGGSGAEPAPWWDFDNPPNFIDTGDNTVLIKPITGWAWVEFLVRDISYNESFQFYSFEFNFNYDGTVPLNLFSDHAPAAYYWSINQSKVHQLSWEVYALSKKSKPCYMDLLSGYSLDNRTIPNYPTITPTQTKTINIAYYRENKLEAIPNLRSINWVIYTCQLVKDVEYILPIVDCVLGTIHIDDNYLSQNIQSLPTETNSYPYIYLFPSQISNLFSYWESLYITALNGLNNTQQRILHKLAANNNYWNNTDLSNNSDILFDIEHPMFKLDNQRAYDWHVNLQTDGSYGDLIMNSPEILEIHRALDAGKWGVNPDDPEVPRLINLGWFIEKIAWFFGIRPKPDGKIDTVKDKASVRQVIDKNKVLDPEKIGVNSFGEDGMVLTRINNRFKNKDIVSDQCVIVKDFIQIVQEYFEQTNLALGIQESSAIQIKRDKTTARFNNQLEILVELVNLMSSGNEMIRANLVSSLVTQSQSNEIIAGLGLPSVTKTIPLKMDDKIYHLPYKGIAAHRSISQEIATCTYNVGLVTGQLL